MQVTRIEEIYAPEAGCTCPARVMLEDTHRAILKYPHNNQGIIVLLNEYISYQIANAIHLTIPKFGIASVTDSILFDDTLKQSDVISLYGVSFFSEYIPNTVKISERIACRITNLDETCRMILLDCIIKNGDRHAQNILVDFNSTTPKMYAIDHSHALGDPDWNEHTLLLDDFDSPYVWQENRDTYTMLIRAGAQVTMEKLESEAELIQQLVTEDLLDAILVSIPSIWISEIGQARATHAKGYILNRVSNLSKICNMVIKEGGIV